MLHQKALTAENLDNVKLEMINNVSKNNEKM